MDIDANVHKFSWLKEARLKSPCGRWRLSMSEKGKINDRSGNWNNLIWWRSHIEVENETTLFDEEDITEEESIKNCVLASLFRTLYLSLFECISCVETKAVIELQYFAYLKKLNYTNSS
jgi:hypothetical protein